MRVGVSKGRLPPSSYLAVPLLLFLLVLTPLITSAQTQSPASSTARYTDHGFGILSTDDKITLDSLETWTNNNMSVGAFENVIQSMLMPLNIREVLLDIGWQNFTVGHPQYQGWVNDWFTASDVMGISNVVYVGQLTQQGFGSQWVGSLINIDPAVATYYSNGHRAPFISLDNPEVIRYLEVDLGLLYSYYGNHSSWVGLGTGSSADNPYYETGGSNPIVGYSNSSISGFINSEYYQRDVNATGYLPNGELDDLWNEYRSVQPGIVLSSGLWMTSSAVNVYGSGADASYVEMRFQVPNSTAALQLGWYGQSIGNPAPLSLQIYGDSGGNLDHAEPLANITVPSASATLGWQSDVVVQRNFTVGYYWVVFSSPLSTANSYYAVYTKNYLINNATAYAEEAYYGPGFVTESSILWIKNGEGQTIMVYPFQEAQVGAPPQTFTANHVFSFNTVFLFLSDRPYGTANATLDVSDVTDNNTLVATGLMSMALDQGLQGWVPISLNGTVTTSPGRVYSITVDDQSITWTPIMRFVTTDPPQAGFQGQGATLLFELGNLQFVQGSLDWAQLTENGNDAVTMGYMDAVRFTPGSNETLKSIQILMYSSNGGQSYSSGSLSIALWNSQSNGTSPLGPAIQQLNIPATRVPQNGLLNVSGFHTPVIAGHDYWIVFSSNSTQELTLARLTNAFEYLVLASSDSGGSWREPSEGPTDFAFTLTLSNQTLGTFVAGQMSTSLTSDSLFAQPFVAASNSSVEGIYLGPIVPGPSLIVSINPTGADGRPAVSPLASSVYDSGNITLDYGPEFIQFSSVAHLQKGEEYWIVIHPTGTYQVTTFTYLKPPPSVPVNSTAVVSGDNGLTWKSISNLTSVIPDFLLEAPITVPPQYNTKVISSDLTTNHDFPVGTGILQGWNAYVQASELSTFNSVAAALSGLSGRTFDFYTSAQANVVAQLNLNDLSILPVTNSTSNCEQLLQQQESSIVSGVGQFAYIPLSSLQSCASGGTSDLAQQLNYTPYVGAQFGTSTSYKVLVVGDQTAANLSRYLSTAFNTAYLNFSVDPSLQVQGGLSSFNAILWVDSPNANVSGPVVTMLGKYIRDGGQLLTTDSSLANLTALVPESTVHLNATSVLSESSIVPSAIAHTEYVNNTFQTSSIPGGFVATSNDLTISAHALDRGRVVFVGFSDSTIPEASDSLVVLSNLVAGGFGASSPFWYNSQTASADEFSVQGMIGSSILVLVYNPSASSNEFSLDLNGTYFGIAPNWKAVQIPGLNVTVGSGSTVGILMPVPAGALFSIMIVPSSEPFIGYSSALVQRQFLYPDQSLYFIQGTVNQSVFVMISSNASVGQILLDNRLNITQASSLSQLYSASSGWYLEQQTGSLFVKYQSTGVDALRFVFYTPPAPPATVIPARTVDTVFVALVVVEAVALTYLAIRVRMRRRRAKADTLDESVRKAA